MPIENGSLEIAAGRDQPVLRDHPPLLFTCLLVLLVISTGFDRLAIKVEDTHFRISYILYMAVVIFVVRHFRFMAQPTLYIFLFIILALPSLFVSRNVLRGVAYFGGILLNYVCVFMLFAYLARSNRAALFKALLYAFRLQIFIAIVLAFMGSQTRAHLLYYEPSYFAIALTLYCAIVFVMYVEGRRPYLDACFLAAVLWATQSIMLLLAILVVTGTTICISRFNKKIMRRTLLATMLSALFLFQYSSSRDDLLAGSLHQLSQTEGGPVVGLLYRSGNRWPRLVATWDVFLENPFIGVGIGAYESYLELVDTAPYYDWVAWLAIEDLPAVNIYLELLSTVGILGTIPFLLFLYSLLRYCRFRHADIYQKSATVAVLSMLILLNFASSYLRVYMWMTMGIFAGLTHPVLGAVPQASQRHKKSAVGPAARALVPAVRKSAKAIQKVSRPASG